MGRATSHTKKDYQTLQELETVLSRLTQTLNDIEASRVAEQDDLGAIDHHWHSRWRVYPQDVGATSQLQASASANVFGVWAKIIPENTIPFYYEVEGIVVEELSATTTYHIQIGYGIGASQPGENMEMGERRMRFASVPVSRASELLSIRSQNIPANASLWGRVKTAAGASDTMDLSVVLARHVGVEREVPIWSAFPW